MDPFIIELNNPSMFEIKSAAQRPLSSVVTSPLFNYLNKSMFKVKPLRTISETFMSTVKHNSVRTIEVSHGLLQNVSANLKTAQLMCTICTYEGKMNIAPSHTKLERESPACNQYAGASREGESEPYKTEHTRKTRVKKPVIAGLLIPPGKIHIDSRPYKAVIKS